MPTHKKGHDKDKYYHLAKDQGFRSRAAFKLIQINKRFNFLSNARVLIDLCAAPGGWCQVAAQNMPAGSIILGIDLRQIKPIRNVKTIVSDITTAECRKIVSTELKGWKADVVLCDGAPDIGAAYSKDAYVQNELVLAALKTATDHLEAGGTFCTKVYRSNDYNALIWVFQQLFEDVQAFKPSSSRSQSSEIFIVCLKYTAPKFVDPKLLDPNVIFKEVSDPGLKKVDVLHKHFDKHNLRHRSGYEDSAGVLLSSSCSASDFITSAEPVRVLTDHNCIVFSPNCTQYREHPSTSPEILEALKDLKILGKIDYRKLLKWRQQLRATFLTETTRPKEEKEEKEEEDEETKIDRDIAEFKEKELASEKREKKKTSRILAKTRSRQAMGMLNNAFEEDGDQELFRFSDSSSLATSGKDFVEIQELPEDDDMEDDPDVLFCEEDGLEDELEEDYLRHVKGRRETGPNDEDPVARKQRREKAPEKVLAKKLSADAHLQDSLKGYVDLLNGKVEGKEADSDSDEEGVDGQSDQWFSHPLFRERLCQPHQEEEEEDHDEEAEEGVVQSLGLPQTDKDVRKEKRKKALERKLRKEKKKNIPSLSSLEIIDNPDEITSKTQTQSPQDDGEGFEVVSTDFGSRKHARDEADEDGDDVDKLDGEQEVHDPRKYDSDNEDYDTHDRAMTLALGTLMLRRSRQKALVDASYNRFAWNDPSELPSWFVDDETRHNKPQVPVPKALLDQIQSRFQTTGTKEIKKVAEARARKKKRAEVKLQAAKKQANAMAQNSELSEREKLKMISKAMKGAKTGKPSKVYVVTSKNQSGSSGKMIGSGKGSLKFVDKRMRKDQRVAGGKKGKKGKKGKR